MSESRYIQDQEHYEEAIKLVSQVEHTIWIGTADLKDLYVKQGSRTIPLLAVLNNLIKKKVSIRLIHAKEPGPNFKNDFDKFPLLWAGIERMLCPRVHFKLLIFDSKKAYIGSANLTGAGIGMKSDFKRNFEAGILTDDKNLVQSAIEQFDNVWMGQHCKKCQRKEFCSESIK